MEKIAKTKALVEENKNYYNADAESRQPGFQGEHGSEVQ